MTNKNKMEKSHKGEKEKLKILVVEDDKSIIRKIYKFLKDKYIIDFAIDGESAIEKARSNKYCLILMDLHLDKGISGLQTTKLIKNMNPYRDVPIIAMTEKDREYFYEAADTNLFEGLLYKPLGLAFLITLVQNILMSADIF